MCQIKVGIMLKGWFSVYSAQIKLVTSIIKNKILQNTCTQLNTQNIKYNNVRSQYQSKKNIIISLPSITAVLLGQFGKSLILISIMLGMLVNILFHN